SEKLIYQDVAGVRVRYRKGGSIGDMYITDFKRNDDGTFALNEQGKPQLESEANKQYTVKIGNMNSKWQLGWSNTFNYKDFQLFFLINGRFGGKVISLTEAYLDNMGVSARSGAAREYAEKNGLYVDGKPAMYLPDGSDRLIAVQDWYEFVGGTPVPGEYVYSATNFRLRELSMGYTFRNLVGAGKHLNVSFIARNLFFFYKDSPADPDVALSTTNGLSAFELFNMPSARSFGFSLKLNF
ncbi:MAG: SusC/RagA family TonB-linked outer membrane protein, partial [Prevotella sp.]|nr:SusC/RagA family TonB-linked outer membrane protein [Prevotella sp.]